MSACYVKKSGSRINDRITIAYIYSVVNVSIGLST